MARIVRAISIRQPYAEQILRGTKTEEYRTRATKITERIYLYASLTPADDPRSWRAIRKAPGTLRAGSIIGTVEIAGCRWDGRREKWAYQLHAPRRLARRLKPLNQPQPGLWRPQF